MKLTLQTPLRNEKQEIYKWESRMVLLNPRNIESAGWVEEIKKVQLLLTSGRCVPVAEGLDEISIAFNEATR